MAVFGGGRFNDKSDRFGNPTTFVKLFDTGRGGLRGLVTINGRRFKLFVTRANSPKKENHTHWCAVAVDGRGGGGGGHFGGGGGGRDRY